MVKPVKKFKVGRVNVSVWENGNGEKKFKSVKCEKRFQDKKGEWQSSSSFSQTEIPNAILGLQKAFEYLALKE
ncbi:MAG: hypothetical protein V1847_00370 [Candidatus Diapherotrites archaeon]